MYKQFKLLYSCIIVSVLLGILFPAYSASAESRSYEVSSYEINVKINQDGSAGIEERITYYFSGEFNGILRNIDFTSTGGIEDLQVYVEKGGSLEAMKLNSTSDIDASGAPGTYNSVSRNGINNLKIYEHSENEVKTFVIKYIFTDVVTKYNDIAEFNRKIVDRGWDIPLNNISINFTLPEGASKEDIRVFGHGPLTGSSQIVDGTHVVFTIPTLQPGDMVETLVVFPPSLVPQAQNVVNRDALDGILANEKQLADQANAQREEAQQLIAKRQRRASVGNGITVALIICWFAVIINIYIRFDKEPKSGFDGEYYRELPGNYTPAEMSALLSMGHVATCDITATLMDLVRKKQLLLESGSYIKKRLFGDKEVVEYTIRTNPAAPIVPLKGHESHLISWFIGEIGDGYSVTLDDITDYSKTASAATQFKKDYDYWCKLAEGEAKENDFFDTKSGKGRLIGVIISLGYIAAGILIGTLMFAGAAVALVVQGLIMIIFSARINRRTPYGSSQRDMWLAFKKFLKDFSSMDKATLPSLVIWEHYLVYAISLGVAKEVIRQLPLVISESDLTSTGLTYMYGYSTFGRFANFSDTMDKTVSSVDNAVSKAMSVANSTLSSSSGGGGGFSGGSSGGGGGGGGGGAF